MQLYYKNSKKRKFVPVDSMEVGKSNVAFGFPGHTIYNPDVRDVYVRKEDGTFLPISPEEIISLDMDIDEDGGLRPAR